jgi:hypothetical protein
MPRFKEASHIVDELIAALGVDPRNRAVYTGWDAVVGEPLCRSIPLVGIRGDTLLVAARTPAHHQHVTLHRREWLKRINAATPGRTFTDIRVVPPADLTNR